MKTYTENELQELLKPGSFLPDEFGELADTEGLTDSNEPSMLINGKPTESSIGANIYGNDEAGYLVVIEEHLSESLDNYDSYGLTKITHGDWHVASFAEDLARFGLFETLEQAQEFVTRFEPIFKTEYGGEFANIPLGTESAEGWSPGGVWNVHAYQVYDNDVKEKWFSFVEFEGNERGEPQQVSGLLGPFEYVNQALVMALAESFKHTKKQI